MELLQNHLLSLILFTPIFAALVNLILPKESNFLHRWTAFVLSIVPLVLSIILWILYNPSVSGFQFQEQYIWYSPINASYHVGVDGISLVLILLTTILTPLAILTSFTITDRVKTYMILFFLLEFGMLGVFLSLDLLFFFIFWEFGLVPMYFIINQWGSEKGEREIWGGRKVKARTYASFKFMVFTMAGSLGLLLAVQLIGVTAGTFDIIMITERWSAVDSSIFNLPIQTIKAIVFWAFAIAFLVKVPAWPFHTWLPDAHTEAPTAGSMILAGVLLKLGGYGFLRLVLPFFPEESKVFAGALAILAVASIIHGALAAYGQDDFKRLVAYSSVNHMGFVILGIAAAAFAYGTLDATIALEGAVLQMFNHGLSAAGMFFLVGVIYERTHTRLLSDYGGLFPLIPVYGGILIFTSMASLGLPGLNGFVSEFLVVRGAWPVFTVFTALAMIGLFFTGAYILKGIKMALQGPLNTRWLDHLGEINRRELLIIVPLMILMLWIGVWPAWILKVINQAVMSLY
ncbi:MAG: NuoM family protein [Anaerolineales bacterium]|jgi:NADH-quinone oxidoreductase subunit M